MENNVKGEIYLNEGIVNKSAAIHSLGFTNFHGPSDGDLVFPDGVTPPTEAETQAEITRLQAEYDALQYQRDRQYPDIGDQLDTLFHDMTAGKGTKDGEWYKAIEQVKSDNPKPE